MRVSVYSEVIPQHGGVAQYTGLMLEALAAWSRAHRGDSVTVFASHALRAALPPLDDETTTLGRFPGAQRTIAWARSRMTTEWLRVAVRAPFEWQRARTDPAALPPAGGTWLDTSGADMVLFPSVSRLAAQVELPSAVAVHDVQHRLQPHFPEFAVPGVWEEIEYVLRNIARRPGLVIAESATGREDLLDAYAPYGLVPDRVMVVPYAAPLYMRAEPMSAAIARVRDRYDLPERYLFYPANILPHKNHAALVEALGILSLRYRCRPNLVLVGDRANGLRARTYRDLMVTARRAGVAEQIRPLGFVPDADLAGLYGAADALTMPSFFGPTNLPLLEAWSAGCPVITSDIRGIREMVGDAAILVDPGSPHDLCEAIHRVWEDADLRASLAMRGTRRAEDFSPERFYHALGEVIERGRALSSAAARGGR